MIAFITNKYTVGFLAALAALFFMWRVYVHIEDSGYQRAAVEYQTRIEKIVADYTQSELDELRRQTIANNAAKAREAKAIEQIDLAAAENLELRRKLASEAQQDPDADRPVLGAGSVQRINQIR